jgi:hypothetical protein
MSKSAQSINLALKQVLRFYIWRISFDLLRKIGKSKEKAFIVELVQLIRENITPADFLNISNPSLVSICINDASVEEADTMMRKGTG